MALLLGASIRNLDSGASGPTREFRKKLPWAIRAALEKTFEYWLRNYAPLHFKRQAFVRYDEYKPNYKRAYKPGVMYANKKDGGNKDLARLAWQIKNGKDTDNPLVKTGVMRQAFLHGSYRFTGSNENLTVKWTSLPAYAFPYRNNQTKKAKAMTEINETESSKMTQVFENYLTAQLAKIDKTARTFGRVAI